MSSTLQRLPSIPRLAAAMAIPLGLLLFGAGLSGCKHAPPSPAAGAEVAGADEADVFPGKPVVRLCKKDWSHERCCAFLCAGLRTICADSPRSQPGIASCPAWCPGLSDKAMRCHVYHCYDSISPTGGIKDHDSHCRHAADQLPGGGCPSLVYEP